jgi:HTH-type transcriptional regulator, sugar sensing transcriptional regulator
MKKIINQDRIIYITKLLTDIGFSDKEIKVYLSVLSLGNAKVSEIAQYGGINRTSAYDILSALVEKGVVSVSGKKPRQEYTAEDPMTLVTYLGRVISERQEQLVRTRAMVGELQLIHNKKNRPKVTFYEGMEGLKTVYENTLTSTETIRGFANVDQMHQGLPGYFPEYYKRRAAAGINIRALLSGNEEGHNRSKRDKDEKRKTVFVDPQKYDFIPEIDIYNNKIMIASWKESLGIIIESEEIADAMKKLYDLAWIGAESLTQGKK